MKTMLCRLLVVLIACAPYQVAQADMIHTDRATVLDAVARADVMQQLQALGVDPAAVRERVAALTDAEARELAGRIESAPAGGAFTGAIIGWILVGLLIYVFVWRR